MNLVLNVLVYVLAFIGVWTVISFAVAPFLGRWLADHDDLDLYLDELGQAPTPEVDAQRIADRWVCEQLEHDNWKADR
jgi:hypothetical protein